MGIYELAQRSLEESASKAIAGDTEETINVESKTSEASSTVLIVGSKCVGKSTLTLRLLERDEAPKPTIALDYTYGRRTRANTKDVGHIYEVGGGVANLKFAKFAITPASAGDLSVVLFVNLDKPGEIWSTVTDTLAELRRQIGVGKNGAQLSEHQDKDFIQPFPVPLVIIGSMYDIFQNKDPKQKDLVCKTMRFLAHLNGASLQFYSSNMEGLVTRGRSLLSHLLFKTAPSQGKCVDSSKTLYVLAGSDSLDSIGKPPLSVEELQKTTTDDKITADVPEDPQFSESSIDLLRRQKEEELAKYVARIEKEGAQAKTEG